MLAKVMKNVQAQEGGGKDAPKTTAPSETQTGTSESSKQESEPQVHPGDGILAPSVVYGQGEPIRGALLFLGAHYVMLDEVQPDDGITPVERVPEGGRDLQFWARVEVALGEAGHDRGRLAQVLLVLTGPQRKQAREILRGGQTRLSRHAIALIQELLEAMDEYDNPLPVHDRPFHPGPGDGGTGGSAPGGPREVTVTS
jgi:hypothetical protein